MPRIELPITRYYGSKRKLVDKIWTVLENLNIEFDTVLDLFGGSATFSYYAKACGKSVSYNDIFKYNYFIGKALIETDECVLSSKEIADLLNPIPGFEYKKTISEHYKDIYFTDYENYLIDIVVQNIQLLDNEYKKASAYYVLFQTCLIKRPFNIFHRKNLSLRTNHVKSNFGNKKTWEKSFDELFYRFSTELETYQFRNNRINLSINSSALNCNVRADLVYIDPPYFNEKGSHVSYHSRYHFLEGLANYNEIDKSISVNKSNKEILINKSNEFEIKENFCDDLSRLVEIHRNSIIVISYRNHGIPTISQILDIVSNYKVNVSIHDLGDYFYALNRNNMGKKEYLIIGY